MKKGNKKGVTFNDEITEDDSINQAWAQDRNKLNGLNW